MDSARYWSKRITFFKDWNVLHCFFESSTRFLYKLFSLEFITLLNLISSNFFHRIIFQSLEFITRVMNKINCNFLRIQTKIKREELALRKFKKNFQTRFPGKQYPDNCISLRSSPFFLRHLVYPSFHIRDRNEHLWMGGAAPREVRGGRSPVSSSVW